MQDHECDPQPIDRRKFVKASLISAVLPIGTAVTYREIQAAEPLPATPEIIDTNVHLFEWPFRRLKYGSTDALIAKLRKHRITVAWAGSFEAVLEKQLDLVNRRLADECKAHGDGMLIPIGSVNPAWPDWAADLKQCHEQHGTPVTDEGGDSLEQLKGLEHLILVGTTISDVCITSIARLANLQSLDLSRTAVSDNGLAHIKELKQLSWLFLKQCAVSEAGVADLQNALPNCHIIRDGEDEDSSPNR